MLADIVVTDLDAKRKRSAKRRKVRFRRLRTAEGKYEMVYSLDFSSAGFADQFSLVFQRAVNKARRENKQLIGTADLEPGS